MTEATVKRKARGRKRGRIVPCLSKADGFVQNVLAAGGRRQVIQMIASESKRLTRAKQAWMVILPVDGSKPFVLNAPPAIQSPAALPEGLISYAADRRIMLLYNPKKSKPFSVMKGARNRTVTLSAVAAMEKRRQNDLSWLGKSFQNSALLIVSLDDPHKQDRALPRTESRVLVLKKAGWEADDLENLNSFLPLARLAVGMMEQKKHLQRRLRQSAAMSEIAQNINATLDLDILLRLIILEVTKAMQCQAGDIWLKSEKQADINFQSSLGLSKPVRGELLTGGITYQALTSGEPVWIENTGNDSRLEGERLFREGIISLAVVPLKTRNKVIGVMHLFAKQKRTFTREERVLLKTLVNQAATAIDNARLFEETKRRAQELLALYEVAQVISEMSNLNYALEQIVERVSEVLNVEKSWFMFFEKDGNSLAAHPAAIGIDEEQISTLRLSCDAPGVSTQVFRTSRPFFTNTAEQENLVQSEFKTVFKLHNVMAVPLRGQEQTLGVFLVANKRDQSNFTGNDVRLFRTLASEATVIIQNANLYDKLRRSYHSVVQVISNMVDAREPYTLGHSERVSSYSATIARQMNLPADEIDRIKMAGLLHDIGKIGISESILLKPGRLNADEYNAMKRHSEIGVQILENVEFPWEIKDLILHHHEFYDGRGYPAGLRGEAIPLGARIIAVCDAFDVITSVRTYHQAKTPWDAFRVIIKESGTQFDPKVIAAFEKAWPQLSEEIESRSSD